MRRRQDARGHTTHRWRRQRQPGRAPGAVLRLWISSAALKAEIPAPHVPAWPIAAARRQLWPGHGAAWSCQRLPQGPEVAAAQPTCPSWSQLFHPRSCPGPSVGRGSCPGVCSPRHVAGSHAMRRAPPCPRSVCPLPALLVLLTVPAQRQPGAAGMMSISVQTSVVY